MRTLEELKSIVRSRIEPYKHRVKSADYHALQIALKFATDARQVETLYKTWQDKLAFKQITNLPDLSKPKPRKQPEIKNAA